MDAIQKGAEQLRASECAVAKQDTANGGIVTPTRFSSDKPRRAEIDAIQKGAERQRRKLLHTIPVVGATCCALLRPVLEGSAFTLVVLDECSQLVEPLSLVPIIRARARWGAEWGRCGVACPFSHCAPSE